MKTVGSFISFLLIILHSSRLTNCLCNLEDVTEMQCDRLEDIEYIDAHQLEKLKVSVIGSTLNPKIFKNLNNLKHLDLSGGNLKRIEPGTFRTLTNLKSLDLANNQLQYLNLSSLEGLQELRSLNLRRNNISQLPVVLLLLKNLKHLDIHGNPLQCNCATLHVRDLLLSRSVKLSKKVTCAGPIGSKGTSFMKLETRRICKEEQDDKEMQGDQPYQGSGDFGSGDISALTDPNDDESLDVSEYFEKTHIEEIETPAPEINSIFNVEPSTTVEVSPASNSETPVSITPTEASLEKSIKESEELFFDSEDQKHQITTEMSQKKKVKDSLFYPVEGSGDEGSGLEGSGIGSVSNEDDESDEKIRDNGAYVSSTSEESIFSMILSVFTDTDSTTEKKEPSIEEEGFINASVIKTYDNLGEIPVTKSTTSVTLATVPVALSTIGPKIVESSEVEDMSESSSIMGEPPEVASMNNELAEVSPAKQSKKGMGSYVVLAGLLVILAGLVGFAAYKGDFCKKKRKRGDVENGTEMKDMQKSLLDTGNQTQPKIASNGSPENMPLVDGTIEHEDTKDSIRSHERDRAQNGHPDHIDHADPVKPPRKVLSTQEDCKPVQEALQDSISSKDESFSERTSPRLSEPNGPPLSPGAQRVKITLQENPDSVPKTPILITRTSVGDNLVKTP
ncbi:PREDICTED: protein windpipe [Polistes dominula]|uniref:Protein windpipe n=1 Tax=Polistes dominula TaxID=743375 RepID=A0ABM1J7Y1_POLDO|nr:PREDICTED: protein windpipe [Polistes dominula]XP_015188570.1 PREDICTED: protein windpipe [Polistes dominula]